MTNATLSYRTAGNISVNRNRRDVTYDFAINSMVDALDNHCGAIFSSNYEYPGRYTRWDTGIVNPPITISSRQHLLTVHANNCRGVVILSLMHDAVARLSEVSIIEDKPDYLKLAMSDHGSQFTEEDRSRAPSVFTVLRAIVAHFYSEQDQTLGLYGAFGYDLAFQFEQIAYKIPRPEDHRDLVLFLPDSILVVDHHAARAWIDDYDFSSSDKTTIGMEREPVLSEFIPSKSIPVTSDHQPGEYARLVETAKSKFLSGDLFEVVPGQTFFEKCETSPSAISKRLKMTNPSPYSFFINLGQQEYLVGASPEMFVRVSGRRVETCPISGTIKRGDDAIADSEQILKLLNSKKDESELTMCSDVDRNDKSRVCEPGSVRVIGRRQIEIYSRLIHTVDHIEGRLREGMDALDAFLSHAWAVTVTGAPKLWAMRFIEEHERSPRAWYGGAVGMVHFNGNLNTGLTIRTVRIKNGIAAVRAGATLLYDSNPQAEEAETELKASAMLAAIRESGSAKVMAVPLAKPDLAGGRTILLVDHEDSFVHTLANYFRQTGAKVTTIRSPIDPSVFDQLKPDLVVLSPGPGKPRDFDCRETIEQARQRNLPIFGVCLGLQAVVEAFGGSLKQLEIPMHGKPSRIEICVPGIIFKDMPTQVTVGRYHSLYADAKTLPPDFTVTAQTNEGIIMAIEHKIEPIAAVQFHPESIMTLGSDCGLKMIENVVCLMAKRSGH